MTLPTFESTQLHSDGRAMSDAYMQASHGTQVFQGFAVTNFSKTFWGRQSRQGAKFPQRRKAISNTLNMGKESVPAMLEKLHALTPSARGHFIGSHSKIRDNRSFNLVSHSISKYLVNWKL